MPTHCIIHGDNGDLTIPCCCYLPTLKTYTPDGTLVGKTKYVCDQYLFVPKLRTCERAARFGSHATRRVGGPRRWVTHTAWTEWPSAICPT